MKLKAIIKKADNNYLVEQWAISKSTSEYMGICVCDSKKEARAIKKHIEKQGGCDYLQLIIN